MVLDICLSAHTGFVILRKDERITEQQVKEVSAETFASQISNVSGIILDDSK